MCAETIAESSCEVCGRGLLPGERATTYLTREGSEAIVCELCRPRAEAAGWLRPEEAEERGGVARERRRPRGPVLSGLLSRRPADGGESEREAGEEEADPIRHRQTPARARPSVAPDETPAAMTDGVSVHAALVAFNTSNHRRTVAGLSRTLGPPRATALAIETAAGTPGARITVAWELTWYQWEVNAGGAGPEVRESGKGETIDQLRSADRAWNLLVASDGTLERRTADEGAEEGS